MTTRKRPRRRYLCILLDALEQSLRCDDGVDAVVAVQFSGNTSATFNGEFKVKLPDDKQVVASVLFVDGKGNPAFTDGVPLWSTDKPDIVDVIPAADGMSATIKPKGPLGSAQIEIQADADMGAGVKTFSVFGQVEIVGGDAVGGTVNFADPK